MVEVERATDRMPERLGPPAGMSYTIRLPANRVLQDKIGHLLKRPVGRPPQEVRRYYSSFSYQAGSWNKPRRVVAKVEWRDCRGRRGTRSLQ
jgi:hypothetical protein